MGSVRSRTLFLLFSAAFFGLASVGAVLGVTGLDPEAGEGAFIALLAGLGFLAAAWLEGSARHSGCRACGAGPVLAAGFCAGCGAPVGHELANESRAS